MPTAQETERYERQLDRYEIGPRLSSTWMSRQGYPAGTVMHIGRLCPSTPVVMKLEPVATRSRALEYEARAMNHLANRNPTDARFLGVTKVWDFIKPPGADAPLGDAGQDPARSDAHEATRTDTTIELTVESTGTGDEPTSTPFHRRRRFAGHRVLVRELPGPSLEDLRIACGGTLSLPTVFHLGEQIIGLLEWLHGHNMIHRDVRPNVFCIGRTNDSRHRLCISDLALAKKYRNSNTLEHIPYAEGKSMRGTARFCSILCHMGVEMRRRDDLESAAFLLIFLHRGHLPWQNIGADRRHTRRLEVKFNTSVEALCEGFPPQMATFVAAVRALRFDEEPDYAAFKELFRSASVHLAGDKENAVDPRGLDWIERHTVDFDRVSGAGDVPSHWTA